MWLYCSIHIFCCHIGENWKVVLITISCKKWLEEPNIRVDDVGVLQCGNILIRKSRAVIEKGFWNFKYKYKLIISEEFIYLIICRNVFGRCFECGLEHYHLKLFFYVNSFVCSSSSRVIKVIGRLEVYSNCSESDICIFVHR